MEKGETYFDFTLILFDYCKMH